MTTTTNASPDLAIPFGAPCWMDLISSDVDKSVAFYTQLFGWTVRETGPEMRGYRYFEHSGKAVGGCMHNEADWGAPDGWSVFLRTDDVRATAAAAAEHGATVLMEPMDVAPNGSFVILRDSGGATISAWQPGTETGFGLLSEAGSPAHFELQTREFDKSVAFYREVFGWGDHVIDAPGFRYATYAEMDFPRAGIMDATEFLPPEAPAHWSVYLATPDVDACISRALELGATLVQPAMDSPYGRLAALSDPTGGTFKLRG